MPLSKRSTLTQFLIEERRRFPHASGDFNALILDVALACKAIARSVAFGALGDMLGNHGGGNSVNVQGEEIKPKNVAASSTDLRRDTTAFAGKVSSGHPIAMQVWMT